MEANGYTQNKQDMQLRKQLRTSPVLLRFVMSDVSAFPTCWYLKRLIFFDNFKKIFSACPHKSRQCFQWITTSPGEYSLQLVRRAQPSDRERTSRAGNSHSVGKLRYHRRRPLTSALRHSELGATLKCSRQKSAPVHGLQNPFTVTSSRRMNCPPPIEVHANYDEFRMGWREKASLLCAQKLLQRINRFVS